MTKPSIKPPAKSLAKSQAKPVTKPRQDLKAWLAKTGVLVESLPYMRLYSGHAVVVKFGGHAMGDKTQIASFAEDIVLLHQVGIKPVVVHGGGPQIGAMLKRLSIDSDFIDGLRVTDEASMPIVEMVLSGAINKSLVAAIGTAGGKAVGISGKDGNLITAKQFANGKDNLGYVGEVAHIDLSVIDALTHAGLIPVIAPVASGRDGATYNINADMVSGSIAARMNAKRLLLLTDVAGIMDKDGKLINHLSVADAKARIADGTITGGMLPKIKTCIDAVQGGCEAAVILNGQEAHAPLVELFTEHGIGTLITNE